MIEIELDKSEERRSREKLAQFERMANSGAVAFQFDARRPGVDVPDHLEPAPNLILKFYPRYATYLHVDAQRVSQMLSFPGYGDLPCSVPWSAVYALYPAIQGQQAAIWALDVPSELRRAFNIETRNLC